MTDFPNCVPQEQYRPDDYLEQDLVSNCCGASAQIAGEGETELCSLCGEGCLIIDANKEEDYD